MMNVVYKLMIEEVDEEDLAALKESISDHILQQFPNVEVNITEEARVQA